MKIDSPTPSNCVKVDEVGCLLVNDIEHWIDSLSIVCGGEGGFVVMSDPDTGAKFMIKKINEPS